ncbi:hypothetical protein ACIGBH_12070 [Streptomyces sp. NPDC085929]|uniref:hypothetical protein n=1 Tax=Streptomyces sp. NPDC085929 TaxID=3365739 RepID=UPI0037CE1391
MALIAEAGASAIAVRARFGESGAVDRLFEGLAAGPADHGADGLDILVIQQALPLLRDGGRIVSMGSAATRIANPLQIGYTVTKAALAALGPITGG